jgi:uncharacterized protein (DUF1778 family)
MKTTQVQIRLSFEQKESIRLAAERAGLDMSQWILSKIFSQPKARLLDILTQLKSVQHNKERSYVLNDFNAFLSSLDAQSLHDACGEDHKIKLDDLMANYVAAMIERAYFVKNLPSPKWLAEFDGVAEPFFASSIQAVRMHLLISSPPSFRRRNLFVDSSIGDLV